MIETWPRRHSCPSLPEHELHEHVIDCTSTVHMSRFWRYFVTLLRDCFHVANTLYNIIAIETIILFVPSVLLMISADIVSTHCQENMQCELLGVGCHFWEQFLVSVDKTSKFGRDWFMFEMIVSNGLVSSRYSIVSFDC